MYVCVCLFVCLRVCAYDFCHVKQITRLAADMGGIFGLYIGFSVLTFAEFLEYMVNLAALAILTHKEKYNNRRKTSAIDEPKSNRLSSTSSISCLKSTCEPSLSTLRPLSVNSISEKFVPQKSVSSPPSYSTVYLPDDKVPLSQLCSGHNSDLSDCDSVVSPQNHANVKSDGAMSKSYTSPLSKCNVSLPFSDASKQPSSETANQRKPLSEKANQPHARNYDSFVNPPSITFKNTSTNHEELAQNKELGKDEWRANRLELSQIS